MLILLVVVALILTVIRLFQTPGDVLAIAALLIELYLLAPTIQSHL